MNLYSDICKKYKSVYFVLNSYIYKKLKSYNNSKTEQEVIDEILLDNNIKIVMDRINHQGVTYLLNLLKYCQIYINPTESNFNIIQIDFCKSIETHRDIISWESDSYNSLEKYCFIPFNNDVEKYFIINLC